MKTCTQCGESKDVTAFPWQGNKRRADCKSCASAAELKRNYGISSEEYAEMLVKQHGVCAVCLRPEIVIFKGKPKQLSVDHNHRTGNIRALLCSRCNTALGLLGEDTTIILALLRYVETNNG